MNSNRIITFTLVFVLSIALLYAFFFNSKSFYNPTKTQSNLDVVKDIKRPSATGTLSRIQVTACTAAEKGGTCFKELPRLGLVSPETCCKYLKACC